MRFAAPFLNGLSTLARGASVKGCSVQSNARFVAAPAVRSISFMTQPTLMAAKKLPVMNAIQAVLGGVRHTTAGHARGLKTKKAVAKRFILTGKGKLKRGHAFRRHLTSHKSPARKRRLACKEVMTGTWAKKMKKLILFGK